jgi:hypothetical protein
LQEPTIGEAKGFQRGGEFPQQKTVTTRPY